MHIRPYAKFDNKKKQKQKKNGNFLVPPKITPFEFARDVNVGDRVSVQCVVGTGDLPLTFVWMKDDVPIISNSVDPKTARKLALNDADSPIMIRQNDEFTSALSIPAIARNQGGTYKCIVENDAAKETYTALLRVNGKKANKQKIRSFFLARSTSTSMELMADHLYFILFLFACCMNRSCMA